MSRSSCGKVDTVPAVQIGTDWLLVRRSKAKMRKSVPEKDRASALLPKAGRALNKPGIARSTVFGDPGNSRVYAYSACIDEPGKIIRESADGKKTVGTLVEGKFKALARKKTAGCLQLCVESDSR